MQIREQLDERRLALHFEDEGELRAFVAGVVERGAFLLQLAAPPRPFLTHTVLLELGSGVHHALEASAVQVFEAAGGVSVAFEVAKPGPAWHRELERQIEAAGSVAPDRVERTGVPPIVRLRQLNVSERMHLASKADRSERAVLMRDASPQVLMALLANPRIGTDDVVQIVRNPRVSPGVIERVAKERRWLANTEVQKALARSPKTPSPIALRLMDSLPTEELRRLAKIQSGLRETLRKAALKVYLKRSRR